MAPDQLRGFTLKAGMPAEDPGVSSLADRSSSLDAWRDWLGDDKTPFYVRASDSDRGSIPFEQIQRLARLGPVWVDAKPESEDDFLDLMFSGAHRIVLWLHEVAPSELKEWMGESEDGPALAVDADHGSVDEAIAVAAELLAPLIVANADAPTTDAAIDVYELRANEGPWSWQLTRVHHGAPDEEEGGPAVDQPDAPGMPGGIPGVF